MSTNTNVVAIVALFLIFLTLFLIYMTYPRNIFHQLKARRIAAQENRTPVPPPGQLPDIEMNNYPLRYPDPVITKGNYKSDDWPLGNPVPPPPDSILARRSQGSEDWPLNPDEDDLKFAGAGGNLEGFPYRL